jgi:hypothetical protein
MSEYPDDAELDSLAKWTINNAQDLMALVGYICRQWYHEGGAVLTGRKFELHTFGWSGNEDRINALHKNWMFMAMCWQSSRRGGHYEFTLPENTFWSEE